MIFLSERHKSQAFFVSLQYTKQGGTVYDYNGIECGTFPPTQYYSGGRIVDAEGREAVTRLAKQKETEETEYIGKEEILKGIDAGLKEVKLTREGKLAPKLARDFLNEL